jgi:hypothetical protein
MEMFFGKKQTGFMNEPPAVNMVNQPGTMPGMIAPGMPTEGYGPEMAPDYYASQTEMGYACDPCGHCGPYYEHTEIEMDKPEPQIYVVQKGDTVYKIAKKFGIQSSRKSGSYISWRKALYSSSLLKNSRIIIFLFDFLNYDQ